MHPFALNRLSIIYLPIYCVYRAVRSYKKVDQNLGCGWVRIAILRCWIHDAAITVVKYFVRAVSRRWTTRIVLLGLDILWNPIHLRNVDAEHSEAKLRWTSTQITMVFVKYVFNLWRLSMFHSVEPMSGPIYGFRTSQLNERHRDIKRSCVLSL